MICCLHMHSCFPSCRPPTVWRVYLPAPAGLDRGATAGLSELFKPHTAVAQVVAARRQEGTTARVNQAFEEEIAARRSGAPSAPKHQLWQAGGLQPLPERLV